MKRLILPLIVLMLALYVRAEGSWTTHFAYNNVDRIAAGGGLVYGVSDGTLFAIEAQTEQVHKTISGLHGTNVACIRWLEQINALMVVYTDGKVDLLGKDKISYIPDLYNKFTTLNKTCHSITVRDSLAYMAMSYGVQTFHMGRRTFVDTYFIGAKGKEIPVYHIAFTAGTIYAASDSTLYMASLTDNVVDYTNWSTIALPAHGKIQGLTAAQDVLYLLQANTCYKRTATGWQQLPGSYAALNVVNGNILPSQYPTISYADGLWKAAGEKGIIRQFNTGEQVTYHLDGPQLNLPYRLHYDQGQLFMLPGGRWAVQNNTDGTVMRYDGSSWHNISRADILSAVGGNYCRDFMNVAVDPANPNHYFVTSYGTGLYEFLDDKCVKRWTTTNSILESAAANDPARYTRTDGAIYDRHGNLWVMNTGVVTYNIVIFTPSGEQIGMNVNDLEGSRFTINTAGQFIFDNRNPDYVWALVPRGNDTEAGLALIDTRGTVTTTTDDHSLIRTRWVDQDGTSLTRSALYVMRQDEQGNIWLGTEQGVLIIDHTTDYFSSDRCRVLHITDPDDGSILFDEEKINDIRFDHLSRPWIATASRGVYVLTPEGDAVIEHYVMDNSLLPSNSILSLAFDHQHLRMYIGSALGLVAYTDPTSDLNPAAAAYNDPVDYGSMMQWTTHLAYTDINDLQLSASRVYALSEGSLCAIERSDESLSYYSKLNGLNGSSIHTIYYDSPTRTLVIAYDDGMIDLLDDKGNIHLVADLYLKQMNTSKQVQAAAFRDGKAYLAMQFGIVVLNIRKQEISDTYYIGNEGSELSIDAIAIHGDSIYAASADTLYSADLRANLVDYSQWHSVTMPAPVTHLVDHDGALYMIMDSTIYCNGQPLSAEARFVGINATRSGVLARSADQRVFTVSPTSVVEQTELAQYAPHCALADADSYWLGTSDGVLHLLPDGSLQRYEPDGPSSNMPYSLTAVGSKLWAVPGGRWASGFLRRGQIMFRGGDKWDNWTYNKICQHLGYVATLVDFGHVAVDPANSEHFAVATYGTGLLIFNPDGSVKQYNHNNSPLESLLNDHLRYRYCRVDAIACDAERNLWVTNVGDLATNIHVIDPQLNWHSYNLYQGGQRIVLNTVSKILMDNRYPNYKWIASARDQAGLILLNDNGTPYERYDDRVTFRSTFVDQDNKSITLAELHTVAQDHNGDLWLGTGEGLLVIDAATNFAQSNACRRLKISRHDGTNLADYLLGTERINTIVFAGGNRVWIGTNESGAYLVHMVTHEGIYEPEILAHFTTVNSPMPSDCVLSIAINGDNGEVYIGTAKGLVSYRGDASDPESSYTDAYVYPNPVRPNYEGVITITGLMDNTTVYIADAAGNVVCRTHSNGGTAVWDGRTLSGSKAHSGVYTIYCNTADGKAHTAIKLLIMN